MSKTIKVDTHRGKSIEFNIEVEGLNYNDIHGKFIIIEGGIEYGFPTVFKENYRIEVVIPPLNTILSVNKKKSLKAKLEIFTDCQYFVPWEGTIKLIETKSVKVELKKASKPKVKIKTEMKDRDVNEDLEIIVDDPEEEVFIPDSKEKKKTVKTEGKSQSKNGIVLNESTKDDYLNLLKNIDEKGIRKYMQNAGTSNEKVQSVILEQAEGICKDSDNKFELLKSVVKIMKNLKKGESIKDVPLQ
jgi:hypothetical protein